MSDKTKFYSLTKPPKFRTLKLLHLNAKSSLRSLFRNVKSVIYNILYKFKIVEKYSFKDLIRSEVPFSILNSSFTSSFVHSGIEFKLFHDEFIEEEYYHEKGNRLKRLFVIKDVHNHRLLIRSHLKNISIKLPGKDDFIPVQEHLPVFKVNIFNPYQNMYGERSDPNEVVGYKTLVVDVDSLYSVASSDALLVDSFWESELQERYMGWINHIRSKTTMDYIVYFEERSITDYLREV